ncbi:MAG TPA: hypothetical protein P5137_04985, partial [Candidatus Brocadiia bacterium]|nr:hypothetical protein [Candidatus Brocadiia bacterium]
GNKRKLEFQELDTFGALGRMTGDAWYALHARMSFDGFLNTYTGMTCGVNPIFRGMVPTITQYTMGRLREACLAADQIAKARQLFPAEYYGLGDVRDIVMMNDRGEDFKVWLSFNGDKPPVVLGPEGKPARADAKNLTGGKFGKGSLNLAEMTVEAAGRPGAYKIANLRVGYFGCSLKNAAFRKEGPLSGAGAPLYVRAEDVGGPECKVLLTGSPGASLEVFTLDGQRLFSKTLLRPAEDAVGVEERAVLPRQGVLRLGDRVGARFLNAACLTLYLSPDAVFELPK